MFEARRLTRRFFYVAVITVVGIAIAHAAKPATTLVSDTVYRADGSPARGTVLISWPTFTTADGSAVAAGTKSVSLGTGGTLSIELVPNAGGSPSGTYYTAVFQLDDAVKAEYWVVPTSSPTSLALIRVTPGTTGSAGQLATRQYVDQAVAEMASDKSVVHVAGAETISGPKQFATPPSVPTPVQATDAVTKDYVDGLVTTTGNGSYVSKAGDSMTGPLVLPGDPTAPNHAATRQYVDSGLASKADLALGIVPPGELGSGTANDTTCLKGNSTWGACGTSTNAIWIQNVPVDASAPTDNQVLTYEAATGKYRPKAGGGVTAGMQAVKYVTDFHWSQSVASDLGGPGSKTITLAACPAGVTGTEPEYYVYISDAGLGGEAVKVTGGNCKGDGQPGTLQFTTVNTHAAGYMVSSASSGLQEALIAGRFQPTNPTGTSQSGKIIVPPGEYKLYARVSIRASNQTVDLSGSILECYMSASCLLVGDPAISTTFSNITVINPRGRPMVVNGTYPFIEVNAQGTRLSNVMTRVPPTGGTFGTYLQVDNDQAFSLDGLDTSIGHGLRCDASFCGAAVTAPGPFASWAAVGWLKNLNISNQCNGNGVDWQSGNTLRVSDSVIQGYSQFGIRTGTPRGGYGPSEANNVYMEVGSCSNPIAGLGIGGIISEGGVFTWRSGEGPQGKTLQFANTGATQYDYYLVPHHATYGYGAPLYAGKALTNGSGTITVTTPDVAGADSFDLLRATFGGSYGSSYSQPYGTGNWAIATGVTRASACTGGVCTFLDTQASLSSYTVAKPTYFPKLDFWASDFVLSASGDTNNVFNGSTPALDVDRLAQRVVAVGGSNAPQVFAKSCGVNYPGVWVNCQSQFYPPASFYEQGAWLMPVKPGADGGQKTNLKGRINFGSLGTGPGHILTLSDSNIEKTVATGNHRPTNDVNDAYIGYDSLSSVSGNVGISLGAPKSISNYIANVGDGTNWLERLTSTLKEFKTDVKINGNLTVTGACTGCGGGGTGTNADTVDNKHVGAFSGSKCLQSSSDGTSIVETAAACGSGGSGGVTSIFGRTGTIIAAAGDYSVTQITGAEATASKGAAGGYASLDAGGKVPNEQLPDLGESQVTGLADDLTSKLSNAGPQTFTGDLTITGKVTADSFESTGSGPWSVEGSYGTLAAAAANKSKMGFGVNGKLSVSENGGPVVEVAKKTPQQFTYTFFDPNNPLTLSLQVPSIYVNRAAAIHLVEVYCEIDAGNATINLQTAGANILSSDLACSTAGATSTSFSSGKDAIVVGQKIDHVTVAAGPGLHRLNVVVKYTVD